MLPVGVEGEEIARHGVGLLERQILERPEAPLNDVTAAWSSCLENRGETKGAFSVALTEYAKVVRQFPNSTLALARMGIAAFHAGEYQVAAEAFDAINEREASSDIAREVNDAIEQMKKLRR